jgi:hypothetical protein
LPEQQLFSAKSSALLIMGCGRNQVRWQSRELAISFTGKSQKMTKTVIYFRLTDNLRQYSLTSGELPPRSSTKNQRLTTKRRVKSVGLIRA